MADEGKLKEASDAACQMSLASVRLLHAVETIRRMEVQGENTAIQRFHLGGKLWDVEKHCARIRELLPKESHEQM